MQESEDKFDPLTPSRRKPHTTAVIEITTDLQRKPAGAFQKLRNQAGDFLDGENVGNHDRVTGIESTKPGGCRFYRNWRGGPSRLNRHDSSCRAHIVESNCGRQMPTFTRGDERTFCCMTMALNTIRSLSEASYNRGMAIFGEQTIVELVAAMGFYSMIAMTLNAFNLATPGETKPLD